MNSRLIAHLRAEEGEILSAYQDHLGFWTIGVGILIDRRKNGGITREESAHLLNSRLLAIDAELRSKLPWFWKLDETRQCALIAMAFQLGVSGLLGFKNMLESIRDEKYPDAEIHALNSTWAKQTPKRARRVARQIATGEWQ